MRAVQCMDERAELDMGARLRAFLDELPRERPPYEICARLGARLAETLLGREAIEDELRDADALFRLLPDPLPERAGRMLCVCALDMARGGAWPEARLNAGLHAAIEHCTRNAPALVSEQPSARNEPMRVSEQHTMRNEPMLVSEHHGTRNDPAPVPDKQTVLPALVTPLPLAREAALMPPRLCVYPMEDGLFVCAEMPDSARGVYLFFEGEEELFYPARALPMGVPLPPPPHGTARLCARASYPEGDSRAAFYDADTGVLRASLGVRAGRAFISLPMLRALPPRLPLTVRVTASEDAATLPPLAVVCSSRAQPLAPEDGRVLLRMAARRAPAFLRLPAQRAPGYITVFSIDHEDAVPLIMLRVAPMGRLGRGKG